ncbi:MAG: protein kinase, partial [Acidobacteriota bacterium]
PVMSTSAIFLSYNENFFSFEFAALNYTNPENNQYAYRLEGFDKDWIYSGSRRYASYTNLDPGEYLFRVKGSNNDGLWNENGISINVIILPPLWRTWWAYLIYLVSSTGIIYAAIQIRLRALKRRNQLLEAGIKSRTIELSEKLKELQVANQQVEQRNEELIRKNGELVESYKRTEIVFSALSEVLPGTILAQKYRLETKIGTGGFGVVYRGLHLNLNRPVAIKILQPNFSSIDYESLERFHIEAISACRVNHANAVTVLDFGITPEGISYLVMELLEGHTLQQELQEHQLLSPQRCAQILTPVCDALACAHAAGIVHRDIKPDNIYLHQTYEGEVIKVVDFGIAKLLRGNTSFNLNSLTVTGSMIGTPSYMSPERLNNNPYDGRADVYSLGVMLYRMLCGQLPFQSSEGDIMAIAMMHMTQEARPLHEIRPELSTELSAVVMQALAKDPNQRPTITELATRFSEAVKLTENRMVLPTQ